MFHVEQLQFGLSKEQSPMFHMEQFRPEVLISTDEALFHVKHLASFTRLC